MLHQLPNAPSFPEASLSVCLFHCKRALAGVSIRIQTRDEILRLNFPHTSNLRASAATFCVAISFASSAAPFLQQGVIRPAAPSENKYFTFLQRIRRASSFLITSTMASVQILPGVTVLIASVIVAGSFMPIPSSLIGSTTDTVYHLLGVRDGMRFVIQLIFDLFLLSASQAEYVEFAIRIDGFNVAHGHMSVDALRARGGVFTINCLPDGMTGMAKIMEFRELATGKMESILSAVGMTTDK